MVRRSNQGQVPATVTETVRLVRGVVFELSNTVMVPGEDSPGEGLTRVTLAMFAFSILTVRLLLLESAP